MMKKIVLLIAAIASLGFASCKKAYTCECTTTITSGSFSDSYLSSAKEYSKKMSKKQAQSACDHEAESIQSTANNSITDNGNDPAFAVATTACSLK
jgi:phage-related tail protein